MNTSYIRHIIGQVLKMEAALMLLPCLTALIYKEPEGFAFFITLVVCGLIGFVATYKKPAETTIYLKEGCAATALCWIFLSIFGAIPFVLTGEIPHFVDALFETVSGFTTTGASILTDVEKLSHCSLLWRSFTHWIGGMGVLVFLLAIIPLSGASNFNLMKAESPGPSVGKLVPKLKHTARLLYMIYIFMTFVEFVLLLCGKMPVFDALSTSFGTAGTGGFGIKADSLAGYSPFIQWVVTIFMILFGVNFNAYYFIFMRQIKKAVSMEEVKCYFIIIAAAIAIIFFNTFSLFSGIEETLRHSSFQVASIITTTGFSTTDFNLWPETSRFILVLLMFIGACAGSTGGGIKVSRIVLMLKTVKKELYTFMHPKSILKIKIDGKPVEHEVVRSVNVYFISFVIIFCLSLFFLSFEGKDLITCFTAVAATINNIGPGLEEVGPCGNFAGFNPFSKIILILDMLAGRLELFPLLILFHPKAWKELLVTQKSKRHLTKARKR